MKAKTHIVGVGSALVDILILENDEFIKTAGGQKGGMTLVEKQQIDRALAQTSQKSILVPGGSACNTIIGVGCLGGGARFIGKRGTDDLGKLFEDGLVKHHVQPHLFTSSTSPTGCVLSIVTPDAQRTMLTYLGASSETLASEISSAPFDDAAIVHLEGYLLFNRDLMYASLKAAKKAGAQISLDLASFTVVESSKDILDDLIHDYVDILIANEDEARAYTGISDETKSLEVLSKKAKIAVLKVGKRGSMISAGGTVTIVSRIGDGTAIDTTGAGDLWAAGFLYGLVNNYSTEMCGKLASACGYEVCQVMGAAIPPDGWQRIRDIMKA